VLAQEFNPGQLSAGPAGDTPTGWLAIGINSTPEEALMRVHAVCVAP
jgi:hypothetical protein